MTASRSRTARAALVLPAAVGLPAPLDVPGASYVALGDSYSAGTGTRAYLPDGTDCRRSAYAFPSLIARATGLALNLRACSGATVADVAALQLDALKPTTSYVSLSVGGNDVAFVSVLSECAQPAWLGNCSAAIDRTRALIRGALPGRLDSLYGQVRVRAPQAAVAIVGYPRLFNGEDCNAGTWFSPRDQAGLNATVDLVNRTTAAAAARAGFVFVDPTVVFTGHAVCDDVEWLNGLSHPVSDSYHPNRAGHALGYMPLVSAALTGSRVAVTEEMLWSTEQFVPMLSEQQAAYADVDRRIRAEEFVPPDLSSPAARAAAARAGVDLSDPASIARADRAAEAEQIRGR